MTARDLPTVNAILNAAAGILLRKAADVVVQSRHPTLESHANMNRGVERHVLKHAVPCAVLA